MALLRRRSSIGFLAVALLATATVPARSQTGRDFRIESYYGLEFEGSSRDMGLLAFARVQNISGLDFRNLVVTFHAPPELKLSLGPEEFRRRDPATKKFADRMENGDYIHEQSFLGKGQTLTIFYRLSQKNLMRETHKLLVFPKVEVSYTVDYPGDREDEPRTYSPPYADEYRLPYDSFQGSVDTFLGRHADISVRLTKCLPDRHIRFMKPVGIRHDDMVVGVQGSSDSQGFFRMQTGFPGSKERVGNLQEILGFWEIQGKDDPKPGPEMLLKRLQDTVKWLGSTQDFAFVPEGEPEEVKLLRERGWAVSGAWNNPQENRMGKGRFRFYAFDVIKNIEQDRIRQNWFLLLLTQANSSGLASDQPDAAAVDQAETALLDELIDCFEKR